MFYLKKIDFKLFKFYLRRMQGYYSLLTFFIVVYGLMIRDNAFGLQWYHWVVLIATSVPVLLLLELKYIYPREVRFGFENNAKIQKEFNDIKEMISELKYDK